MTNILAIPQIENFPRELQERTAKLIEKYPEIAPYLNDLINHLNPELFHHKKSKIVEEDLGPAIISFPELSFIFPNRKRMKLSFHSFSLSLSSKDGINTSMAYSDIQRIFFITTPGKAKPHSTILIVPVSEGVALPIGTIAFGFEDINPIFEVQTTRNIVGKSAKDLVKSSITAMIENPGLTTHDKGVFVSSLTKHAKYHIDCFLKAKNGHLFFFETGVLFGLKKPSMFFKLEDIELMEVTGVTGRFFNLYVTLFNGENYEFAMIEVGEYDGIASYIERLVNRRNTMAEEDEVGSNLKDAELALSDDDDHDYQSASRSDASIAEEFDSDHDTSTELSHSNDENESYEEANSRDNDLDAVIEANSAVLLNPLKPGVPLPKIRPGEPVHRNDMTVQLAVIEHRRALQKKQTSHLDDTEEDLQDTSCSESIGSVGLALSGNGDDFEVDELQ